jgi:TetR/AcrR family transcriptional repressor of nem operon
MSKRTDTAERILDLSESLVQQRGFNGFSYQDVADALGVRKASLHYHFPSKAALGATLIERYRAAVFTALPAPGATEPWQALDAFLEPFRQVARRCDRMCLAGVLAAEFGTLPQEMQTSMQGFFRDAESWLDILLAKGRDQGAFCFDGSPRAHAQVMVAALEGALLVGRTGDPSARLATVVEYLKNSLRCGG